MGTISKTLAVFATGFLASFPCEAALYLNASVVDLSAGVANNDPPSVYRRWDGYGPHTDSQTLASNLADISVSSQYTFDSAFDGLSFTASGNFLSTAADADQGLGGGTFILYRAQFYSDDPLPFTLSVSTSALAGLSRAYVKLHDGFGNVQGLGFDGSTSYPSSGSITGTIMPNVGYFLILETNAYIDATPANASVTGFSFTVAPIPEPSTVAFGLAGLLVALHHRRRPHRQPTAAC